MSINETGPEKILGFGFDSKNGAAGVRHEGPALLLPGTGTAIMAGGYSQPKDRRKAKKPMRRQE